MEFQNAKPDEFEADKKQAYKHANTFFAHLPFAHHTYSRPQLDGAKPTYAL